MTILIDQSEFYRGGFAFLIVGMLLLVLSLICFYYFLQSDYFVTGWWNGGALSEPGDTIAVLFGTYFLPLSIIMFLLFANLSYKNISQSQSKVLVYILCIFIFTALAGYGQYLASDVFYCLSYFCINNGTINDTGDPSASNFIGLLYFLIGIFFDGIFGTYLISMMVYKERVFKSGPVLVSEYDPILPRDHKYPYYNAPSLLDCQLGLRRKFWSEYLLLGLVFVVLYPLLFIACLIFPTGWNNFSQYGIQNYQQSVPSQDYGSYTGWYVNYTYFKLYPDILVYYMSIYLVVGLALLCKVSTSMQSFFYYVIDFRLIGKFNVAQISLTLFISLLLLWQFLYFYYDHVWENADNSVRSNEELAARALGQVSNMIMGFLTLPVAKNSIWSAIFDIPWSNAIIWHQVMGYSLLIVIGLHMLLWWAVFDQEGIFPQDILAVPSNYHVDNFTIALAQITYFIMLIVFGVFTLYAIRRWSYELFYYTHLFSTVVFFVVLWHSTMSWYYITAGLVLWAIDIFVRSIRTAIIETVDATMTVSNDTSNLNLKAESTGAKIIQLRYQIKDNTCEAVQLNFQSGQFCWINIPEVSLEQWHPFSISSAPIDAVTTHHIRVIKSESNSEWTSVLESLAESKTANFTLNISGPYGRSVDLNGYSNLLMISGGIGITPLHSYLRQLYLVDKNMKEKSPYAHIVRVRFIFIVRTSTEFEMFEDIFRLISKDDINGKYSAQIYITDKSTSNVSSSKHSTLPTIYGKPGEKTFITEVDSMIQSHNDNNSNNKKPSIFVSGPSTLVSDISSIAFWKKIEVHTENFLL